jgi:serine/threonine-protein kinase
VDSDAEVAAARIGRTVGSRWTLERVLGIGGMAAVYQARDPHGTIAAVKILHPEMSAKAEVRERFLREGYAANKIGHPGVVQALEHGDRDNDVFLAMELLEGETLRSRVQRHGRLPVAEVLDYAEQILDVLVAAHAQGVIHRDLKPDNLFVTHQGRIKVLDFGLARLLDGVPGQHRTRTGVALGTLAYMAPEQALGRRAEIDGRVDVFALGATMFRILSGRRVHEAESEAELLMAMASRPAPPLAAVATGLPPPVGAVVDLALAFSREARYPDARSMLSDVRALRAGGVAPFALARLASRDEATRADGGAVPSQRTQPLEAKPPSSRAQGTMPLLAYAPPAAPTPPPGFSPQEPSPISFRPPAAEPQPGYAPNSLQGYAQPGAVAQTAYGSTMPASAVPTGAPGPSPKRSSVGLLLVLGGLFVVGAGGLAAVFFLARSSNDLGAALGPASSSGVPIASVAQPASAAAAAAPTAAAVTATAGTNPAQPGNDSPSDEAAPGAVAKADSKRAAPSKPVAQPSGASPAASTALAPAASAGPAAAPAAAAAPAPAPAGALAPSPNTAPAAAPAPPPSAAGSVPNEGGPRRGPPRRGRPQR